MEKDGMTEKIEQKKISFIVPVYNVADGDYLLDCLESIERVDIPDMEVWMIDDGSTDGSGDICDGFADKDARFHVLHQENAGVSAARNAGMCRAQGEWFFFVDGDDLVPEDLGEKLHFEEYENADVVIYSQLFVNEKGKCIRKKESAIDSLTIMTSDEVDCLPEKILYGNTKQNSLLADVNFDSVWGKLYKSSFVKKSGICFEGLKRAQDKFFNLQIAFLRPRYLKSSSVAYYYRARSESVTHRYLPEVKINSENIIRLTKRVIEKEGAEDRLRSAFYTFVVSAFLSCVISDFCHPGNPKPYRDRRDEFRALRAEKEYDTALRDLDIRKFKRLGTRSRITVWLCRIRAFNLLSCYLKVVRAVRVLIVGGI